MSKYILPSMALPPTAKICTLIENIASVQSDKAIDTITLENGQNVIIKSTSGPYILIAEQPQGIKFYENSFDHEDVDKFELVLSQLTESLQHPMEYVIPYVTAIPINREGGDSKAFVDAIKAAMRSEPDSIVSR
jgi:hypothetical protein